ncbi:MAG TPA: hypothetical protein VEK11_19915 [Thermoanaerobaculia bacterium]|nr:hypothetical protein [Thermoanaerobaculia bacterium]
MTSSQRRTIFILAGVSLLAGMGVFGFLVWTMFRNVMQPPPPRGDDRRLVVTAEALQEFGGPTPNPAAEELTAIGQFDGSRNINYEYNTSKDPNAETRLVTSTTTMVHGNALSAIQAFKMQQFATKAGVKLARGAQLIDTPALLTVGDANYAGVFRHNNESSGNLLVVRQGRYVFTVVLIGLVFDEPKEADALMLPLVEEAKKRS